MINLVSLAQRVPCSGLKQALQTRVPPEKWLRLTQLGQTAEPLWTTASSKMAAAAHAQRGCNCTAIRVNARSGSAPPLPRTLARILPRTSLQGDLCKAATPTRASASTSLRRNPSKKLLFASGANSVPFYWLNQHWTEESLLGTHLGRFGNIFWRSFQSRGNFNFFF